MHTVEALDADDVEYRADGRPVARGDVLPTTTPETRVGVVMGSGTQGLGAGNFLLACVRAFYDHLAAREAEFFAYPDFYTVQATAAPADYRMLDVYPDHKNAVLDPDADDERLLRAVNDRAVDVLLVPDGPARTPAVADVTRRSAERGIDRCYVYAADGRPADPGFSIRLPREPTAGWFGDTVDSVDGRPGDYAGPSFGSDDRYVVQAYRETTLEGALSRLPTGDGP